MERLRSEEETIETELLQKHVEPGTPDGDGSPLQGIRIAPKPDGDTTDRPAAPDGELNRFERRKFYVCKMKGEFPSTHHPKELLEIGRKTGLASYASNIVHDMIDNLDKASPAAPDGELKDEPLTRMEKLQHAARCSMLSHQHYLCDKQKMFENLDALVDTYAILDGYVKFLRKELMNNAAQALVSPTYDKLANIAAMHIKIHEAMYELRRFVEAKHGCPGILEIYSAIFDPTESIPNKQDV